MSYQVLARKWRPANFKQMVGQEHVLQALGNALDSNRLHHAYLFSGTRGVGKTTIARIFAKSLNCEQGISSEPCGQCSSCSEVDQGRSVDLIEIDAASRTGVDDMRELLDNVQYAPTRSRFKIYLIDEVHMLSKHSFNALLKTLEEPPPHIKFLLATTDPQKVPVTVLSRCLQFNLKRMSKAQIVSQLLYLTEQEAVAADESALVQLASAADGSMRDALSLLDQAIGYGAGQVREDTVESMLGSISRDYLLRLLDALSLQQASVLISEARQVIDHNPDYQRVCAEMISLLQQIALYQSDPKLIIDDEPGAETLRKYSECWSPEEIQLYYQVMLQGRQDLLICPDEAAGFEMLMLRLVAFSPQPALVETSEEVKKKPEVIVTEAVSDAGRRDSGVTQERRESTTPDSTVPQSEAPAFTGSVAVPRKVVASPNTKSSQAEPGAAKSDEAKPCAGAVGDGLEAEAALDWSMLAYKLGLTGIAQELVANSQLQSYTDKRIVLQLPGELYELVNDLTRAEILQALQQKLGVSLSLELTATAGLTGETPLQAKKQRECDDRVSAIAAIRDDEMVKKLQHVFDAELDEASVVKIDSNG
ncbi:MAG: DNA polymerase III subunit gamma/tau [Gammaproteobacteria bacterium]|jgi:DNA polymerase-3 subunit gamma/tau|nr:DNA polymerase III subunit gamma/tau [Gammaproteobacteria bacterium]